MRFNSQKIKEYFTPRNEIRVEPNWLLETLLAAVVSNIVRELELTALKQVAKDKRFIEAKALSQRISETYRSFGISALGVGASYGTNVGTSQPIIVPSTVLGHHLEDLAELIVDLGYKNGLLVQLNNLDVGAVHSGDYLKYIFNALRDYMQTRNTSWFLVGDVGIRAFIASKVDRVDDIISHEVFIKSLSKKDYYDLITKRINFYRTNENAVSPIVDEVFEYLYDITNGRLRYIFGLVNRLITSLRVGDLIDIVTMEVAKPAISELAKSRIKVHELTYSEEQILKKLVEVKEASVKDILKVTAKNRAYLSRVLNKFLKLDLVSVTQKGTSRLYIPSLDAKIAYS
jgi:DNA-binding MarR family transcriptional regulator